MTARLLVQPAVFSPSSIASERSGRLMTAEELADRWQVSKAQVYRMARENLIPSLPIGRYVRFRLEAIEAWEAEQDGAGRIADPSELTTGASADGDVYPLVSRDGPERRTA